MWLYINCNCEEVHNQLVSVIRGGVPEELPLFYLMPLAYPNSLLLFRYPHPRQRPVTLRSNSSSRRKHICQSEVVLEIAIRYFSDYSNYSKESPPLKFKFWKVGFSIFSSENSLVWKFLQNVNFLTFYNFFFQQTILQFQIY